VDMEDDNAIIAASAALLTLSCGLLLLQWKKKRKG
jgi:LPXTG-motif cell wall-anchored protein